MKTYPKALAAAVMALSLVPLSSSAQTGPHWDIVASIREEGLQNCWARHERHHIALKAGLEAMGLKFFVKEEHQIPQMNAVNCPEGINEAEVRKRLLTEFGIEIGAGLGPLAGKIWRFGLMGYSCRPDNVMLCLSALGSVLDRCWVVRRFRTDTGCGDDPSGYRSL